MPFATYTVYSMSTSSEKPLVSIGIPTYNRADTFLPVSIESALAQSYKNVEIIVSDNCSTDNTEEVVKAYSDNRIKYLKPSSNLGANGNFNNCLDHATGDYFLLLCDDDAIDADFVEVCMGAIDYSVNFGFVRTGTRTIDHTGKVLKEKENRSTGDTKEDFYLNWFDGSSVLYLSSTLFNVRGLRAIGGLKSIHNLLEDGVSVVKLFDNWPAKNITEVKASFRKSPDQRTFNVPVREWCKEFKVIFELINAQLKDSPRGEEIRRKGEKFFASQSLSRAKAVHGKVKRLLARLTVARYFGPQHWP